MCPSANMGEIYQRLFVARGGFFLLLDLGPGAAACGMGNEINTDVFRSPWLFAQLNPLNSILAGLK